MTLATRSNLGLPGSKNPLPTDVHATLPDRLAEHSGLTGSKFVPYTYASGDLAPGFTPTRDPEMTARGGAFSFNREGEKGGPSSLGQAGFNAPNYSGGPIPDRTNTNVPGSKNPFPNNAALPTRDPEMPTVSAGSNVPDFDDEGSPDGI